MSGASDFSDFDDGAEADAEAGAREITELEELRAESSAGSSAEAPSRRRPPRPPSPKYHKRKRRRMRCETLAWRALASPWAMVAAVACSAGVVCVLLYAAMGTVLFVYPGTAPDVLTFRSASEASRRVGSIARGHWRNLENVSREFIARIRTEWVRRKEAGHQGGYAASTVDPLGGADDPIDGRVGNPHHHIDAGKLPPVCPRMEDHLGITFDLTQPMYDPFGLPCALEMHWSAKLDTKEVEADNRLYFNQEGGGAGAARGLNGAPFRTIRCTRRYRMQGFTPWDCVGLPALPTRFSLVHNIGCVDVDPRGAVNVRTDEVPYSLSDLSPDKNGRVQIPDNSTLLNPAYDRTAQTLEAGHYCYINYAVTENTAWRWAVRTAVYSVLLSLLLVSCGICCVTSHAGAIVASAIYWLVASTLGIAAYIYLWNEPYIHAHMLVLIQWGLVIVAAAGAVLYTAEIVAAFLFGSRFDIDNGCTQNHPLCLRALDSIMVANGYGSFIRRQQLRKMRSPVYATKTGWFNDWMMRGHAPPGPRFDKDRYSDDDDFLYDIEDGDIVMDAFGYPVLADLDEARPPPPAENRPRVVHEHDPDYRATIAGDNPMNHRWANEEERTMMYDLAKHIIAQQDHEAERRRAMEETHQMPGFEVPAPAPSDAGATPPADADKCAEGKQE